MPAVADTRGRVSIVHSAAETDGLVRGDFFLLRVQRMAAIGADAAGDLELLAIELLEA